MDVVLRWEEGIELARGERTPACELEPPVPRPVELLVLVPLEEADEPPRQMVVHGSHRPRRHDEAEQRERAIGSTEEEPLADATAHPALGRRLLVALRKPGRIGEEPTKERL